MGEGIAQGFAYAELAADAILDAGTTGDYRFSGYHRSVLRSPLGRELRLTARTADYLYNPRHFPFWISLLFENARVRSIVGGALAEGGGLSPRIGSIALSALGRALLPWMR
jgi:flavin-dependent dehydrogenase